MIKRIIILLILAISSFAQDIPNAPNPPRLVNDFVGGLMSPSQINALEQKLRAYNDSTSTQISVVIVKTVEPSDIFSYSQELAKKWGIGQAGKNNGILILWAPGDRKVRIHTGFGMEGVITDARSKRIISQIIGPFFKELKYYDGLDKATDQIIEYAAGEHQAEPQTGEDDGGLLSIFIFILFVFIILSIIGRNNRNNGNNGGGRRYADSGWPFWTFSGGGSSSGNWGGGGSSGWGSDSGGGGFGGFGGGGFGGGGASGDY